MLVVTCGASWQSDAVWRNHCAVRQFDVRTLSARTQLALHPHREDIFERSRQVVERDVTQEAIVVAKTRVLLRAVVNTPGDHCPVQRRGRNWISRTGHLKKSGYRGVGKRGAKLCAVVERKVGREPVVEGQLGVRILVWRDSAAKPDSVKSA